MVTMKRLLVVSCLFFALQDADAQSPDSTFWSPNGPVNSIVLKDSTLFVGGNFDQVSPVTGSFVRLDTSTALPDPALFKLNGTVHAMVMDSLGYIYIGGNFSRAGNQSVENLIRITPTGQFDNSFVHSIDGPVYALCIDYSDTSWPTPGLTLFIGGEFDYVNGELRHNAAAINVDANAVTMFDPNTNGPVYAMLVDSFSSYIYIGGDFTAVGTLSPPYVAKVNRIDGVPFSFNAVPWTATPNTNGPVHAIANVGSNVMIGGEFTSFASIQRKGLAILHWYNGALQPLSAGLNGSVNVIRQVGSKYYFGGSFSIAGGDFRDNIACVDDSFNLFPWQPPLSGPVYTITMIDSVKMFVGGDFLQADGDSVIRGALIDTAGAGFVHPWRPLINASVYASAVDTLGRLYVGGAFFGMGGVPRQNLCAINVNLGTPTSWNPQVNYPVNLLLLDSDTLYVAGDFTVIDNFARNRIAAINIGTNVLTNFNPGVNGLIRTLSIKDSMLYCGGNFSLIGGQPRDNLARVNKFSGQTSFWNPGCMGTVNAILPTNDWIYVAGFYSTIGGQSRENLSRLSFEDGTPDWNWICDTDDGIYHAEFYNNNIVLGGWFATVNGQAALDFAVVDTASRQVQVGTFSSDGFVRTFTRFGDDFFISGSFDLINNQYHSRLFDFDFGDNGADNWSPAPNATPESMICTGPRLYIGGAMSTTGGVYHPFLQVLNVQWITSVAENNPENENLLSVYPVPSNDMIIVQMDQGESETYYAITDLTGKTVQEGWIDLSTNQANINVATLSSGTYILQVNSNDLSLSTRVIVAR